jgi:hypothetical protein
MRWLTGSAIPEFLYTSCRYQRGILRETSSAGDFRRVMHPDEMHQPSAGYTTDRLPPLQLGKDDPGLDHITCLAVEPIFLN